MENLCVADGSLVRLEWGRSQPDVALTPPSLPLKVTILNAPNGHFESNPRNN